MVMLMITTPTTMTKYALLTSRGHVEIGRFDDKSLQVMEYIKYICFHLRIFHFMFVGAGSIEVFRHDIMEHINEMRVISCFG